MSISCTIITIGDELLIGQIIDTNSAYIAQKLCEIGIAIRRRIAIADDTAAIVQAIEEARNQSEIIIMTGGLGPTKDDITKKTLAEMFQVGMKRDPQTYQHVRDFFMARNRPFLEVNQAQADVPANAEVLFNLRGTAPGMWFDLQRNILISLPGVPYEMEYIMTTHVIDKLAKRFQIPPLYHYHIQTMGMGESFLAETINHIENELPASIKLAYLPSPMAVNLRLSGNTENRIRIEEFGKKIEHEIEKFVFGNSIKPIEQIVFETMLEKRKTLTLVESCTGGYLAHLITNFKGASEIFCGGWNVYTDAFKQQELDVADKTISKFSAVSEECGVELLVNALKKTNAHYGISVVGYLEKSETVDKPYAFITYGDAHRQMTKKLDLFYPRVKSKEAIAKAAFVGLFKDFLSLN